MLLAHMAVGMLAVRMQYTWQLFARRGLVEQKYLQLSTKHQKRGGICGTCRQGVHAGAAATRNERTGMPSVERCVVGVISVMPSEDRMQYQYRRLETRLITLVKW